MEYLCGRQANCAGHPPSGERGRTGAGGGDAEAAAVPRRRSGQTGRRAESQEGWWALALYIHSTRRPVGLFRRNPIILLLIKVHPYNRNDRVA